MSQRVRPLLPSQPDRTMDIYSSNGFEFVSFVGIAHPSPDLNLVRVLGRECLHRRAANASRCSDNENHWFRHWAVARLAWALCLILDFFGWFCFDSGNSNFIAHPWLTVCGLRRRRLDTVQMHRVPDQHLVRSYYIYDSVNTRILRKSYPSCRI